MRIFEFIRKVFGRRYKINSVRYMKAVARYKELEAQSQFSEGERDDLEVLQLIPIDSEKATELTNKLIKAIGRVLMSQMKMSAMRGDGTIRETKGGGFEYTDKEWEKGRRRNRWQFWKRLRGK